MQKQYNNFDSILQIIEISTLYVTVVFSSERRGTINSCTSFLVFYYTFRVLKTTIVSTVN